MNTLSIMLLAVFLLCGVVSAQATYWTPCTTSGASMGALTGGCAWPAGDYPAYNLYTKHQAVNFHCEWGCSPFSNYATGVSDVTATGWCTKQPGSGNHTPMDCQPDYVGYFMNFSPNPPGQCCDSSPSGNACRLQYGYPSCAQGDYDVVAQATYHYYDTGSCTKKPDGTYDVPCNCGTKKPGVWNSPIALCPGKYCGPH
jgi:hypothetical protein